MKSIYRLMKVKRAVAIETRYEFTLSCGHKWRMTCDPKKVPKVIRCIECPAGGAK